LDERGPADQLIFIELLRVGCLLGADTIRKKLICGVAWHAWQECELPYPLQKEEGEGEDSWALRDPATGATVLRLRFTL